MKKILYVIPRLAKAGTERHLLKLAEGLSKRNFQISICCLFEIGELDQKYDLSNIRLISLRRKSIYDPRIIFDLLKLIKKEKYDIVHTYLFGFHYLASLPAKISGAPLVISSRRELARWKKPHHHFFENFGNIFTDKVIACSEEAKDFALNSEILSTRRLKVIYNGIDLGEFRPRNKKTDILDELGLTEHDKIIGMVANFSPIKDHYTILKSMVEIKKKFPRIKCILIGDGVLKSRLEDKAEELALGQNVIFAGRRDDVARLLSVIDIFVLTSLCEGLPNAILEAMASGLPVVATNAGGISEAVEDYKSGILIEPKNYKSISSAIIELLTDESLRQKMGRYGRQIAEQKFSLERMIKDYEGLYSGSQIERKNYSVK